MINLALPPRRLPGAFVLAGVLFAGESLQGQAAPPLVTDRPDFTESAEVIPRGLVQLEAGYTFARSGSAHEHSFGEVLGRVPVARRLELRFGLNSLVVRDVPGEMRSEYAGLTLGAKVRLVDGTEEPGWRPTLALVGGTTVPLDGTAEEQRVVAEGRLAVAWVLASRVGLAANLGALSASEGEERVTRALASVSLGFEVASATGAFVEWFGFFSGAQDVPDVGFVDLGFTRQLGANLQLDLRGGLNPDGGTDYFVGAGVSARW